MQNSSSQRVYGPLAQTIHSNWNLSAYARTQKELRLEASKLSKEEQEEHLVQVFNNRPPVLDEGETRYKKIVSYDHDDLKFKSQLGVIHPEHRYQDPRQAQQSRKTKEEQWFQQRASSARPGDPNSSARPGESKQLSKQSDQRPATTTELKFEIETKKIDLKPPPLLEREKPFMQEHLVSPYIYIQKVIKRNSEEAHMRHPDIWDTSTNKRSLRNNKQIPEKKKPGKELPKGKQSKLEREQQRKEKDERKQFYLQNLRMREFLFKFFKTVNKLLKDRHYSKVIYQKEGGEYDLGVLFRLWAQHKGVNIDPKGNPQQYVTKDQFSDFMLVIGLDPQRVSEAERFFDYCHELVQSGGTEGKTLNEKGVIVPKWWKMFEENQKGDRAKDDVKDDLADFI